MAMSELGPVWVILLTFIPAFACGSLLRTKGLLGWLAIAGIIAVAAMLFMNFTGWHLGVGAVASFVGLAAGGKLSDALELEKMKKAAATEKKQRDDRLRKHYSE